MSDIWLSENDRLRYYRARCGYLQELLGKDLSAKQRREAESELERANIKRLVSERRAARHPTSILPSNLDAATPDRGNCLRTEECNK